jgi:hypothetical protein
MTSSCLRISFVRFFIFSSLISFVVCCKQEASKPASATELDTIIALNHSWQGVWSPSTGPRDLPADNYPFLGTVIGVSKRSLLGQAFTPDSLFRPRIDSVWANTRRYNRNRRTDGIGFKTRAGETIYVTVAAPGFNPADSQGNVFQGSVQCIARLTLSQDGITYQLASQTVGIELDATAGWTMVGYSPRRAAQRFTDSQGREWVMAENSFVVP